MSDVEIRSKSSESLAGNSISGEEARELWRPDRGRIYDSGLNSFLYLLKTDGLWSGPMFSEDADGNRQVFESLHRWSIENAGAFWRSIWRFGDLLGDLGQPDCIHSAKPWEHRFFPDGTLNFAENEPSPATRTSPRRRGSENTHATATEFGRRP